MPQLLHILTKPQDALAAGAIAHQRANEANQVEVTDLTQENPNYSELLEKIFAADSVQVW